MNITQEVSNFLTMFGPCEIMTRGRVDLSGIDENLYEKKEHACDLAVFNGAHNFGYNEVDQVTTLMYFGSVPTGGDMAPVCIFNSSSAGHKYCRINKDFVVYSLDPQVITLFESRTLGETTTPEPPQVPKSCTTRPPDEVWNPSASLYTGGTVREDDLDDVLDELEDDGQEPPNVW